MPLRVVAQPVSQKQCFQMKHYIQLRADFYLQHIKTQQEIPVTRAAGKLKADNPRLGTLR